MESNFPLPPPSGASAVARRQRFASRKVGRVVVVLARLLLIQAAALWLALRLVAPTYPIGPLDLQVRLRPSMGGATEIMLPPLGQVSARTHTLPVTVSLLAAGTRVQSLKALVAQVQASRSTLSQMRRDARRAGRALFLTLAVAAFLCAAALAALVGPRSVRRSAVMGAACSGISLAGGLWVAHSYRPTAFRQPRYTGVLAEAPAVLDVARRGFANLDKVRGQLQNSATNLARFYSRMEAAGPSLAPEDLVRVLHVSDLHNSIAGVRFVRTLAQEYDVKLIACTGDLTDYGSPLENRLLDAWRHMPAPTLFVSGNHDSRTTVAALRRLPNATVIEGGEIVERLGLRFIGWADPVSERPGIGDADYAAGDLDALERRIRGTLGVFRRPPDVLMLHNYRVAERLAGSVPLLLYGHDHRARVTRRDGSVLVDAGTTGAAGVRYFTVAEPPPFTAALLSFRRGAPPLLDSVDLVEVRQPEGSFSIQHFTFE
jgi:predicted MPP superfamily phosphohydrolase